MQKLIHPESKAVALVERDLEADWLVSERGYERAGRPTSLEILRCRIQAQGEAQTISVAEAASLLGKSRETAKSILRTILPEKGSRRVVLGDLLQWMEDNKIS